MEAAEAVGSPCHGRQSCQGRRRRQGATGTTWLAERHQAGPGGGGAMRYTRGRATRGGTERREYRLNPNLAAAPRVFYGPICNSMAARTVRVPRFSTLCARPPPPPGPIIGERVSPLPMVPALEIGPVRAPFNWRKYCRYTVNGVLCVGGVQTAGACGCRIGLPCQLLSGTELKIDKPAIGKRRPIPQSRRA